jgi:addiction module HigA family antidote
MMGQTGLDAGLDKSLHFFSARLSRATHAPHVPRSPPLPGIFLQTRFLYPLKISQEKLAKGLGVSRRRVNELIRGHRAITPDTALRLGIYFGTGAAFWMNLQQAWDIHRAWHALREANGQHLDSTDANLEGKFPDKYGHGL